MIEDSKQQLKNRATIIGLILLFTLPILVAWFMVFFTDFNDGKGGYEHGTLVTPARQLPDMTLLDPLNSKKTTLYGKWTMLIVIENVCDDVCKENLHRMRQIRLATGKEMSRLQRAAYFNQEEKIDEWFSLFADYKGQSIISDVTESDRLLTALEVEGVENNGAIHLVDPAGYYMMIYPYDTDPGGIIKDLKRLLRISRLD